MSSQGFEAHGWKITIIEIESFGVVKWSVSNPITGIVRWCGESNDTIGAKAKAVAFAASSPRRRKQPAGDTNETIH